MLKLYECGNCGYTLARWHINLTGSVKSFCENCFHRYTSRKTHITDFNLNGKNRRNKCPITHYGKI